MYMVPERFSHVPVDGPTPTLVYMTLSGFSGFKNTAHEVGEESGGGYRGGI